MLPPWMIRKIREEEASKSEVERPALRIPAAPPRPPSVGYDAPSAKPNPMSMPRGSEENVDLTINFNL